MRNSFQEIVDDARPIRDQALGAVPIKRIIQPEEVAELVRFLTSAAASAITGQTYTLCGGQTMD